MRLDGGRAWLPALQEVAPGCDAQRGRRRSRDADGRISARPRSPSPGPGCSAWGCGETRSRPSRAPFREGMIQEDRLRRLGDRREGEWRGR